MYLCCVSYIYIYIYIYMCVCVCVCLFLYMCMHIVDRVCIPILGTYIYIFHVFLHRRVCIRLMHQVFHGACVYVHVTVDVTYMYACCLTCVEFFIIHARTWVCHDLAEKHMLQVVDCTRIVRLHQYVHTINIYLRNLNIYFAQLKYLCAQLKYLFCATSIPMRNNWQIIIMLLCAVSLYTHKYI